MSNYYFHTELDMGDATTDNLAFTAHRLSEEGKWHYQYEVTLPSTRKFGGGGKLGDYDFVIGGGDVCDVDEDTFEWDDFARENCPCMPQKLADEIWDDYTLCQISDMVKRRPDLRESPFDTLVREYDESEGADVYSHYNELAAYAKANRWEFDYTL